MRHRLDFGSRLAPQVRTLLVHECTRALQATEAPPIAAVHDLRRAGKRSRAWLRLICSGVSKPFYHRENQAWRELGRRLSPLRDEAVIADCLVRIGRRYATSIPIAVVDGMHRHLNPPELTATQLAELRTLLDGQRQRLEQQDFTVHLRDLVKGHARSYRAWLAAGEQLRAGSTGETRHTWRKRGKELAYQIQLLAPLWPTMLRPFADRLGMLNACLGTERDLALTCAWLSGGHDALDGAGQMAEYAQQWRRHVQEKAEKIGIPLMEKGGSGALATVYLS